MFLILQELESLGYLEKDLYIKKLKEWKVSFEKFMNKKTCYKILPISLNYFDENKLKDKITNKCSELILDMNLRRKGTFFTAVKFFEYPNRILSIRILIIGYYSHKANDLTNDNNMYQLTISDDENINDKK